MRSVFRVKSSPATMMIGRLSPDPPLPRPEDPPLDPLDELAFALDAIADVPSECAATPAATAPALNIAALAK